MPEWLLLLAGQSNTNRDADKSLARPGRKQATVTEDFDFHISYLESKLEEYYYYLYIYNKTSIKQNILTIKQNTSGSRSD